MSFLDRNNIRIKEEKFSDDEGQGSTVDEEKVFLEGPIKIEYSVDTTEVTNLLHPFKLNELEYRRNTSNAAIPASAQQGAVINNQRALISDEHKFRRPIKQEKASEDDQRKWKESPEINTRTAVDRSKVLHGSERLDNAQDFRGRTFPKTTADASCQTDDFLANNADAGCQADLETADVGCQTDVIAPSGETVPTPTVREVSPRISRGLNLKRLDAQEEVKPLDLRLNVPDEKETNSRCVQNASQDVVEDIPLPLKNEVLGRATAGRRERFKDTPEETVADRSQARLQPRSHLEKPNRSYQKESVSKCAQDASQETVAEKPVPVPRENEVLSRNTEELRKTLPEDPSEDTATDKSLVHSQSKINLKRSNGSFKKESVSKCTGTQDTVEETVADTPVPTKKSRATDESQALLQSESHLIQSNGSFKKESVSKCTQDTVEETVADTPVPTKKSRATDQSQALLQSDSHLKQSNGPFRKEGVFKCIEDTLQETVADTPVPREKGRATDKAHSQSKSHLKQSNGSSKKESVFKCTQDTSQEAVADMTVPRKKDRTTDKSQAHLKSKSLLGQSNGSFHKESVSTCTQDTSQEAGSDIPVPRKRDRDTDKLQAHLKSKSLLGQSNGSFKKERVSKCTQDTSQETFADIPAPRKKKAHDRSIPRELRRRFKELERTSRNRFKSNLQWCQLVQSRKSRDEVMEQRWDRQRESPHRKSHPHDKTESYHRRCTQSTSAPRERCATKAPVESNRLNTMPRKDGAQSYKRRREAERNDRPEAAEARRSRSPDPWAVSRYLKPRSPKRSLSRTKTQAELKTTRSPSTELSKEELENFYYTRWVVVSDTGDVAVQSDAVVVNPRGASQGRNRKKIERLKFALEQQTNTAPRMFLKPTNASPETATKNPLCEPQGTAKNAEVVPVTPAQAKGAAPLQTSETLSIIAAAKSSLRDSKNLPGELQSQGTMETEEKVATPAGVKRAAPLQASGALSSESAKTASEDSENAPSKSSGGKQKEGNHRKQKYHKNGKPKRVHPLLLPMKRAAELKQTAEVFSEAISTATSEAADTPPQGGRQSKESDLGKPYYVTRQDAPEQTPQKQTAEVFSEAISTATSEAADTPPQGGRQSKESDLGKPYYVTRQDAPEQTPQALTVSASGAALDASKKSPVESPGPVRTALQLIPPTVKPAMLTQSPKPTGNEVLDTAKTTPQDSTQDVATDVEILQSWLNIVQRANSVLSEKLSPLVPDAVPERDTGTTTVPQELPSSAVPEVVPKAASDIAPKWKPIPDLEAEDTPHVSSVDASKSTSTVTQKATCKDAVAVPDGRGTTSEPELQTASTCEPHAAPVTDAELVSEAVPDKVILPVTVDVIKEGIRCNICNITFLSRDSYDEHRQSEHRIPVLCGMPPRREPYKCAVCKRGFPSKESSFGHVCYDVSFYRQLVTHYNRLI